MEFGFIITAVIAWMVFSAVREAARKLPRGPGGAGRTPLERGTRQLELPESFADASPGLRELLEALEGARSGPARPPPEPKPVVLDEPEFREDTTSLEDMAPETAPRRVAREAVDLDAQSIEAARRRREAAAQREMPRTAADHATFDARIRQEPADATAVAKPHARSGAALRDAIIWREILSRPVSLRDD